MRPKFVLTTALLTVLVLAAAFYVKKHLAPSQPPVLSETASLPLPPPNGDPAAAPHSTARVARLTNAMTPEQVRAFIQNEIASLQDLSTRDDPASLAAILNGLTNSEKEVRLAAIEAARQFGSRDAIPTLKTDAANNPDVHEQIALLQAADFLALPTIADSDVQIPPTADQMQAAQERRDQAAARRQARFQQHPQSQNPAAGP